MEKNKYDVPKVYHLLYIDVNASCWNCDRIFTEYHDADKYRASLPCGGQLHNYHIGVRYVNPEKK